MNGLQSTHANRFSSGYGAEPPQRPADAPRRSYTQLEYDLARELKKPVYVFLTGAGFPADPYEPEDDERMRLQQAHRQQLAGAGKTTIQSNHASSSIKRFAACNSRSNRCRTS